MQQEMKVAEK